MTKNYNIGLDIGTTSVGWAVINPQNFKVIRKGNKYLWGVRLFEEATTAEARRLARTTRRRYDRRRKRIELLQAEFESEIKKLDKDFYTKMQETFYHENDTQNKKIKISQAEKNAIKKYNKEYPTIYHLRKRLIENSDKCDIRLVYLAIHHIIKYRGNFLYGTGSFKISSLNLVEKLEDVFTEILDLYEMKSTTASLDYQKIESALFNPSKNDKKILLEKEFTKEMDKKLAKELVKLLIGDKFSINILFNKELEEDIKISLKGSEYDDKLNDIIKNIPEEIEVLEGLKEIYDMVFLKLLFKDSKAKSLSGLMVERYENHEEDLKNLKDLLKINRNIYDSVLKNKNEACLYEKYIHNKINYNDFSKELKKNLEKINDNILVASQIQLAKNILKKLEEGTFLPKITDVDNGKFPYQLNKEELEMIIKNQGKYYPFLLNRLEDDTYKIVRLLEFRIPYYVGPLNNTTKDKSQKNPNAWLERKEDNVTITPYNFNKVVDLEKSAEIFIKRMIGTCTYLLKEPAMPNNSILYSKFKVLNELKQIKVGATGLEEKLSLKTQKKIFEELFLKTSGTITDKKIKEYLRNQSEFSMYDDLSVIGYSADKKFANNMEPYVAFFGEHGYFKNTNYTLEDAEDIINQITIFEDKEILKNKLSKEYSKLDTDTIKQICSKKYKGWSSLSKKLLTQIYYKDKKTNISKNIMNLMEETNENFMQILNNEEYDFNSKIKEFNHIDSNRKINYEVINDLATSPATKRGIYQALKIIEEIIAYMGYEPTSITLEMARGDEKKKRKDDKKLYLEKIYEAGKKNIEEYNKLKKELASLEKIEDEKLFLYFIQEGKSLYSGTSLDINRLSEYEVDHIIPRTLIKDNSWDNKALVLREENQIKAASFVLPEAFRTIRMKGWWQHLKNLNLISAKKYNNLCRYKFDEKSIEGFINRQLVETRQICKHVANIINEYHRQTKVSYIPASLSHNYREKFELYKFREINNYHHAHDAYLAAVLGEYKNKYLKKKIDYQELKEFTKKLYDEKRYRQLKDGYVLNSLDSTIKDINYFNFIDDTTGEVLFDVEEFNKTVKDTLYRNDILMSRKIEFKTGEFYNQTKLKKGNKGLPLKANLPTKLYGSYSSLNPAYAIVVKYSKKNKEEQKMIGVPIVIASQSKKDKKILMDYLKDLLKLKETEPVTIIKDKIPFNSLIDWEGQLCYLVGASETVEVCNATELKISKANMEKWQTTFLRLFQNRKKAINDKEYNENLLEIIDYIIKKIETNYKLYQNSLEEIRRMFDKNVTKDLEIEKCEKIIIELLHLLKTDSRTANLKFLNEKYSASFGRRKQKTINHAKIINKSVTGVWEYTDEF